MLFLNSKWEKDKDSSFGERSSATRKRADTFLSSPTGEKTEPDTHQQPIRQTLLCASSLVHKHQKAN